VNARRQWRKTVTTMEMRLQPTKGFTLIELMVAVAVTGILATIAVTSYRSFVLRAHRTEAKSALLDMASLEERFLSTSTTGGYSSNPTDLGYPAGFPIAFGSGYYNIPTADFVVVLPVVATATPGSFRITGVAIGTQVSDTACATYTVTSAGARTAKTQAGIDNTTTCWQ
jgi:type IV pilus assembly protein PilE